MANFNELKEGDKIFTFADKPTKREWGFRDKISLSGEFISGVYAITKIINSGFLIKFKLVPIIGTSLSYISINKNAKSSVTRMYCWSNIYDMGRQKVIFTTSEEEWLKMINEEV
jgi:hypothetical protein